MDEKIYTFALLTSLYDSNEDILDAFIPLVVRGTSDKKFVDTNTIQGEVKEKSHIEIPLHVLKTLSIRAKRKGYLEQKEKTSLFKRKDEGTTYTNSLEKESDVQRRINGFFGAFIKFASENELDLNQDKAKDIVDSFLNENIYDLVVFLSPEDESIKIKENEISRLESRVFTKYLLSIQDNDQANYEIFKELIQGSIIASVLSAKYTSDIELTQNKKFSKETEIYLDTNVIFSLLNLHTPEKNIAAKELLSLLKSVGFSLKVFDFTVDEAARYITSYIQNSDKYSSAINVDAIYSTLKQQKWGKSDVLGFVSRMEELIEELGIDIDYQFDVNLSSYEEKNSRLRSAISNYKKQVLSSSNHDIAVIEKIRELRKKSVRRIEDAKVFFLTSDHALQRFDNIELGHKDNGTFAEVILDRVLTSILWVKDTSIEVPVTTVIASHSRDLLINRKVWEKFYSVLQKLNNEGKTTTNSVATLFYHNYIQDSLQNYDESSIDEIDEKLVLEKVEEAEKIINEEKGDLENKLVGLAEDLFEEKDERQQDLEKFSNQISILRANIKKLSKKKASRIYNLIYVVSVVASWSMGIFIYTLLPEEWLWLWNILIGGGLLVGVPIGIHKIFKYTEIKNKLTDQVHHKMKKELALEDNPSL